MTCRGRISSISRSHAETSSSVVLSVFCPSHSPRRNMVYSLDRDTPCRTLEKVPREELQAIAARVEALGIPCSVA